MVQFVDDGFEMRQTTGAVFVDPTAVEDTVNHRSLSLKLCIVLKDRALGETSRRLLDYHRFYVDINVVKSKRCPRKNGLPQGSVLAPLLFDTQMKTQPFEMLAE